ncbi:MAG: cytochrome c biogenesis protein CcsA [Chthoniobacterales bacterium]|nr:cytochrome c biogenesis protein CcsA [Chthoniobacterales bacterium]
MAFSFKFSKKGIFFEKILFFFAIIIACASSLQAALPSIPNELETLPIQEGGRRKPYFVFCEETLRALSGRTQLVLDGKKEKAPQIVTSFWLEPEMNWVSKPLVLISHRPLKEQLRLPLTQKLFSYEELSCHEGLQKLLSEVAQARKNEPRKRLEGILKEASDVGMRLALFEELVTGSLFRVVPDPLSAGGRWKTLAEWEQGEGPGNVLQASAAFETIKAGWSENNPSLFLQGIISLREALASLNAPAPIPDWKLQLEVLYQKSHPFRGAWILYALAGCMLLLFPRAQKKVQKTKMLWALHGFTWLLVGSGFFLQATGLLARVLIAGRPPVTNMYESVIWVAFGTMLFALIFESIYHGTVFLLGAIPVAVASLILADSQPMILDPSLHPLTPVLRDNFWLTIHVLTITLSYAAFALSLGVAHAILIRVILGKQVQPSLYNYLYRILQVGVLLLATGTILGGVWANYSWGRFWDWDPKETWALVALLGYLFLLHGRIAGRWGGFGLAVGSVLAFMSVLMAWYGVNFVLGAGLHSYGFGTGGLPFVLGFIGLEVGILATAFIEKKKNKKN